MLEHGSLDVRLAAGENIALVFSVVEQHAEELGTGSDDEAERDDEAETEESDDKEHTEERKEKAKPETNGADPHTQKQEQDEVGADTDKSTEHDEEATDETKSEAQTKAQPKQKAKAGKTKAKSRTKPRRSSSTGSHSEGATDGGELSLDVDELIAKLHDLSTDSSHRKTKVDKRKQHSVFRDVLKTVQVCPHCVEHVCVFCNRSHSPLCSSVVCVQSGDEPSESLKIDDVKRQFAGWGQLIQLNALRQVLAEGLQIHFRVHADHTQTHTHTHSRVFLTLHVWVGQPAAVGHVWI